MLNNAKMSKSTGNFLTLKGMILATRVFRNADECTEAVEKYSADGMRFALAMAGDGMDDANFSDEVANMAVLRLHTILDWTRSVMEEDRRGTLRTGPADTFWDRVLISAINRAIAVTDQNYKLMNVRDALLSGFFDLQEQQSRYVRGVKSIGLHRDVVCSPAADHCYCTDVLVIGDALH